jgi:predicted acyl esterase
MTLRFSNAAAAAAIVTGIAVQAASPVSRPGHYEGYSPVLYDGAERTSVYVPVRDGTRIAIDIIRPTMRGKPVETRLPVVWMNTPYNRRLTDGGETAKLYPGAAMGLVKYGYVVAIADMRGNYASFGRAVHSNRNEWMPWAKWDAYDITEWLAGQPWSTGAIGMWGCSATGHSQWQAASTAPPHLKAIFPMSAPSEYYPWGGIAATTGEQPRSEDSEAAPVDADADGRLLAAARAEHQANLEPGYVPYRDSPAPELGAIGLENFRYWLEASTFTHLDEINRAAIPAYQSANYGEDIRVKQGVAIKIRNVKAPLKTVIGPANHCQWTSEYKAVPANPLNITVEELRWFDYWLKGVRNGVTDEPPITYFTYNAPADRAWRSVWQWPVPDAQDTPFFLGADATLGTAMPKTDGSDRYQVDYGVTPANRSERGLTYTTAPLAADTTLTGHPVVHLWASSTASDGDFLAWLADIGPDGKVTPLPGTDDGQLRASHRALGNAPFETAGLPYHRSYASDVKPLAPGAPVELAFDLAPVSWLFKSGHRIRLILANVAAPRRGETALTPALSPPPVVTYFRDPRHASFVSLPLVRPIETTASLSRAKGRVVASLSFPRSLDPRYLADIRPGSVVANGVAASRTRLEGNRLIAEFDGARLRPNRPVTITGAFGRRFDYGELDFAATARSR